VGKSNQAKDFVKTENSGIEQQQKHILFASSHKIITQITQFITIQLKSTTTPPNNKIKFKGKSIVMKELQRTIALQCYNEVFKGTSRSKQDQHKNCYTLFHGNPNDEDSYGFAKQLLEGLNMFAPLFEREANNASGLTPLVLHQYYHCMNGTEIIVSNESKHEGITMSVLTATSLQNKQLIAGRTIYDAAKLVVTNARKAMAIVHKSEYQQYVEQGSLPSGKEIEDYYYFIRQEMYKLLKTPSIGDDDDTGNGKEDKNEEEEVTNDGDNIGTEVRDILGDAVDDQNSPRAM